jgi:hypothetical protein
MHAFRFLAKGAMSVSSQIAWSKPQRGRPGEWLGRGTEGTRRGVLAHRVDDLPYWVHDELYRVELRGPIEELSTGILARELRLCAQIDEWTEATRFDFGHDCIVQLQQRAADLAREQAVDWAHALRCAPVNDLPAFVMDALEDARSPSLKLLLGYLSDACRAQQWGLTNSVARIAQVALADRRIGQPAGDTMAVDDPAGRERARQANWLRKRLPCLVSEPAATRGSE